MGARYRSRRTEPVNHKGPPAKCRGGYGDLMSPQVQRRDRHGRGLRGQSPWHGARRFQEHVQAAIESLEPTWGAVLRGIEFVIADIPDLPVLREANTAPLLDQDGMPLAEVISGTPTRIIFYRHPITIRCTDGDQLEALVLDVLIEEVAELVGVDPEDVDERYGESE